MTSKRIGGDKKRNSKEEKPDTEKGQGIQDTHINKDRRGDKSINQNDQEKLFLG